MGIGRVELILDRVRGSAALPLGEVKLSCKSVLHHRTERRLKLELHLRLLALA